MSRASDLERTALAHRRALRELEIDALRSVVRAYQDAIDALSDDIAIVARPLGARRDVDRVWVERYAGGLLDEAERAFAEYAGRVGATLTPAQRTAVVLGREAASEMIGAAAPSMFAPSINRPAVEHLVGTLRPGAPVRAVLDSYGPAAREVISRELTTGGVTGASPKIIARRIADKLGGELLTRAMALTRTELNRASLAASLETYQASPHIVRAYRRTAAKSSRTCMACIALDGTVYPLDRFMPLHVNDRCTMIPVLFDRFGPSPEIESGADWFSRQPESVQQQMMGRQAFSDYQSGAVGLSDFAGQRHDPVWGDMIYNPTLTEMRQPKGGKRAA